MLTVCYINRQPGRGYHFSDTNACGESAASRKQKSPVSLQLNAEYGGCVKGAFNCFRSDLLDIKHLSYETFHAKVATNLRDCDDMALVANQSSGTRTSDKKDELHY